MKRNLKSKNRVTKIAQKTPFEVIEVRTSRVDVDVVEVIIGLSVYTFVFVFQFSPIEQKKRKKNKKKRTKERKKEKKSSFRHNQNKQKTTSLRDANAAGVYVTQKQFQENAKKKNTLENKIPGRENTKIENFLLF